MQSSPLRILHFIESSGVYGAEQVILNLSREMRAQGQFQPVVGCIVAHTGARDDLFDAARDQGMEALKLVIPNSRLLTALPQAVHLLRKQRIALIHSHGYKPSVHGFVLSKMTGIPVMATCHLWFDTNKAPLRTRFMVWLEKYCYRWFPMVVAVSEPIRQVLLDSGIPRAKTQVVKNGVSLDLVNLTGVEKAALKKELGLDPDSICLLNTGRLDHQKSQATLIEAVALVAEQGRNVELVVVGQGPLEAELRALAAELQLSDRVHLLGFRSDVPRLLAIADLFALPSLDEGMPMSLLEAAATAKAIVTTAVGDIPKLVQHEQTGLVVLPEDPQALAQAITRLMDNPELAHELGQAARARMQSEYSSRAMGQSYHAIYLDLLDCGNNARRSP